MYHFLPFLDFVSCSPYISSSYPLNREEDKGAVPPSLTGLCVMSHPRHARLFHKLNISSDSWFFMLHSKCGILRSDPHSKCLLSSSKHLTGKGCWMKAASATTQCKKHRNMNDVQKKKKKQYLKASQQGTPHQAKHASCFTSVHVRKTISPFFNSCNITQSYFVASFHRFW